MTAKWIKALVPPQARPGLRRAWDRARFHGRRHECPVCESRLRCFLPWGFPVDQNFLCPICRSKPPHRLATLYFRENPSVFQPRGRIVHVAPEPELQKRLQRWAAVRQMEYRSGSISGQGDQFLDLLHLPFADESVNLIYCCHVINALQEDRLAMAEVFRVLHPQGTALLQVPAYATGPQTIETTSRDERLAAFHDEGIYRCYTAADYIHRLQAAGFVVECFRSIHQPPSSVSRYELKGEVLHVCKKPNAA
jgi:SAM-dependent methyltransferase